MDSRELAMYADSIKHLADTNNIEKENEMDSKVDNVNHPSHYESSCSIECIDAMVPVLGFEGTLYFCAGNAFKYLWRFKNKNGREDLEKAEWYIRHMRKLNHYMDNHHVCGVNDDLVEYLQYLYDVTVDKYDVSNS